MDKLTPLIGRHGNLPALSIKQPWAWLIVSGLKDIEKRNWTTDFRGRFYVHTGKTFDTISAPYFKGLLDLKHYDKLRSEWDELPTGGIVGISEIVDCVDHHPSKWFSGKWGFVLSDSKPVSFTPCKGTLGFFFPQ